MSETRDLLARTAALAADYVESLGERPAERLVQLLRRHVREDRPLAKALDVVGRERSRAREQVAGLAHGSSANSCASRRPSMMFRSYASPSLRATFSEAVLPWMISAISRSAPSSPSA